MALTLDTVKNFAEWDQSHWRTFFQTHGYTLAHRECPADVRAYVLSKEFQETMVKVGIIGGRAKFEQIPRIWNRELNQNIPSIAPYGEPRHYTNVTLLVTRVILAKDDFDEALLIKREAAEPFMLLRLGNTWHLESNATSTGLLSYTTNRISLVFAWEEFEQAAKLCVDESARSTLLVKYLTQSHSFAPSLANLAASYNEIFDRTVKEAPKNDHKEPESVQKKEPEPLPKTAEKEPESCWDSFCAYINSWANWFFSLFT